MTLIWTKFRNRSKRFSLILSFWTSFKRFFRIPEYFSVWNDQIRYKRVDPGEFRAFCFKQKETDSAGTLVGRWACTKLTLVFIDFCESAQELRQYGIGD